ncbi:MAG: 5'-nucleotidase C-terminal domain-containing protein [Deltaproteobacteria bacterium]|nr:5'-nucleotidase C-terminal domain-containing protein [Deltaproteobacteria bacterium]
MRHRRYLQIAAILSAALLGWGVLPNGAARNAWASRPLILTIIHVNDTHAHLAPTPIALVIGGERVTLEAGGFARLASKVAAVRKRVVHPLLLHGGDVFQGTLYFARYEGLADLALMNLIGFDAMAAGNHEFDKGPAVFARFVKGARFPVLAANVDASGNPALAGCLLPYVVKSFDGERVAIVGLAPPETPWISAPGRGVTFSDPMRVTKDVVKRLEAQGIDKIIVLSHCGYDQDIKMAKSINGVDIIVGGHSHTLLGDFHQMGLTSRGPYPTGVKTPSGAPVFVVQAWESAKVVGVLHVGFDDHGVVTACHGHPVILCGNTFWTRTRGGEKVPVSPGRRTRLLALVDAAADIEVTAEDKDALTILATYDQGIEALRREVIARAARDLVHTRIPGRRDLDAGDVEVRISDVAPLVAQAMLWKVRDAGFAVQIFVQNAGGIRSGIAKGPVSAAQAYEVLPFGNTLWVIRLSGKAVRTTLEKAVSRGGGAFPYVAGMRYRARKQGRKGFRVTGIEVEGEHGTWIPLNDHATYLLATNGYLAKGGNGYRAFKRVRAYRQDTGLEDAEAFIEYARHMKVLDRPEETGVLLH